MKKIYSVLCILIAVMMSSCGIPKVDVDSSGNTTVKIPNIGTAYWNRTVSFDSDGKYQNIYQNMREGGLIANCNNSLYVSFGKDIMAFSEGKVNKLNLDRTKSGSIFSSPIFSFNDKLYIYTDTDTANKIYVYDFESDRPAESELNISPATNDLYLSREVCAFPYQEWNHLKIQRDGQEWMVDEEVDQFDVTAQGIYFTTPDAALYFHSFQDRKSRFLAALENGYIHHLIVIGNTCYYIGGDMSLYAYRLDDSGTQKLLDTVQCLNAINGKVYALTDKNNSDSPGIYSVDNTETEKVADISTDKIYMFDEDYIYTYDMSTWGICQVNLKDRTVTKVFEVDRQGMSP